MPPQDDEPMAVVVSEEEEETKGEKAGSYWDEPPEEKLQGKTLSTLSLTGLGRVKHDGEAKDDGSQQSKKDDDDHQHHHHVSGEPKETPQVIRAENPAKGGYWDFQEVIRKSLSKLSLSDLAHGASFTPNSTPNTTDGNPNNSPSGTVDNGVDASEGIKRRPSTNSFWFWPNRSANNLQDIQKDKATDKTISRSTSATGGYWFWRNASANNLSQGNSTDSNDSLETLEKKARESDRLEGRKGPISKLQHRMRNTWRASFQRLSTNTLSKLDESSPAVKEKEGSNAVSDKGWKEDFEKGMKRNDSFLVQEEGEESMTF